MGLSGRISTMLLVFLLLSGVLVGSWLFWGNTLRATGQASARLLEDTIRLAVQDARSRLRAAVDHPAAMVVACKDVPPADVCLAMTLEGEVMGELITQGKALQPGVSKAQPQGFGAAMLRQLPAGSEGGAGVVYWQQQPLWVEYRIDGGTLRLAGVVLERLLNQWSTDMRMGMNWRWRTPEDRELPWGMANVQLQAVSGSAIGLLVSSSMLTPALVGNWSGVTVVILAGALTVISWLLFYRPVWRRLDNLLYQLRGILSQRDYSGRVNLGGHDEIAELDPGRLQVDTVVVVVRKRTAVCASPRDQCLGRRLAAGDNTDRTSDGRDGSSGCVVRRATIVPQAVHPGSRCAAENV